MNLASRLIQIGMIACIGLAVANYVGRQTAAKIETLYVGIVRQLEAVTRI